MPFRSSVLPVYDTAVETLKPRSAEDVESAVREALARSQPLEIAAHGSKRAIGHASATNARLDCSALDAVVSYEPQELVLTVQPGAPLQQVQAQLAQARQEFAFEPMDPSALLGVAGGTGTVGGMIASGLAGPRRVKAGGVRDHLLGLHGVSGFGDRFKAGGKVVKNVTGYDLCKLIAGSFGTLAVMTEVTLKVMPKAETETTLMIVGLDAAAAGRAMTAALGSPYDVSAAAHLPSSSLRAAPDGLPQAEAATLIRLEGIEASVAHRAGSLTALLAPFGRPERLAEDVSAQAWRTIRDVAPFAAHGPLGQWPVWRIVCPPASGPALGQALARETGGEVLCDWAGGLVWLAVPPSPDGFARAVRLQAEACGGHAMLLRAGVALRAAIDVFHPLPAGLAALNARIKAAFDPQDIFNRGRMVRA